MIIQKKKAENQPTNTTAIGVSKKKGAISGFFLFSIWIFHESLFMSSN